MDTQLIEEILENLYSIRERDGSVTMTALAERIGVEVEELDRALFTMEEEGYVHLDGDVVVPTSGGEVRGRRMVRKHRLLEFFLHNKLGMDNREVHDEACKLEHALSDDAEEALCRFLDHPRFCPDDHRPIPECPHRKDPRNCEICRADGVSYLPSVLPLSEVEVGKVVRLRSVRGGNKVVRRLRDMGLVPDVTLKVVKRTPMGGPIELELLGTTLALGRGVAHKILVEVEP